MWRPVANHGGLRPGAGRPAEAGERRTELLKIPLSPAEKAELLDFAGEEPLATAARDLLLMWARRAT